MKSLTDLYRIGYGPSSSHTMGPAKAARIAKEKCPDADGFRVTLYGSLACTGTGHGTGKAIRAGLPGAEIVVNTEEKDLPHPNTKYCSDIFLRFFLEHLMSMLLLL